MRNIFCIKRLTALLLILTLCMGFVLPAGAETVDEWNRSCRVKTKGTTAVFKSTDSGCTGIPIASIPGGTYVKISSNMYGIAGITYMTANGVKGFGNVKSSNLVYATVIFTAPDGTRHSIQEIEYWETYGDNPPSDDVTVGGQVISVTDSAVWDDYLKSEGLTVPDWAQEWKENNQQGYSESDDDKPANSSPAGSKMESSQQGSSKPAATTSSEKNPAQTNTAKSAAATAAPKVKDTDVTWNGQKVEVDRLGTLTSSVLLKKKKTQVPTNELSFGGSSAGERHIAVITAPDSGQCILRRTAYEYSPSITHCKAGRIVGVVAYGDQFCKVNYYGKVGFVRTRCLRFLGEAEATGTGLVSYNGYTNGRTSINIRNSADKNSETIAKWPTGTEAIVFAVEDGWYEVEYNGVHGFIMEKYFTYNEN